MCPVDSIALIVLYFHTFVRSYKIFGILQHHHFFDWPRLDLLSNVYHNMVRISVFFHWYLLGILITYSSWFLYTVFDHLFCISTFAFEQPCQFCSWIINSFFHYFMEKRHEIIKIHQNHQVQY